MNKPFLVNVRRDFGYDIVVLDFYQHGDNDSVFVIENIVMRKIEPAEYNYPPPIVIQMEQAQKLMDGLWNAGVRPTETRDRSEVVNAMKNHIQDLQKLAFVMVEQNHTR